jgi:hypothetical protein
MGSQWVMLERQFCEYLCEDNPLLEQFKGYFRQFNIPDEHYVQTVALNSPFIDRIDSDIRRCIYIPTDESHPKIMTVEDYPQLMSSGCFFARKFDDEVDAAILDALDVHIFAKVPVDNVNNSVDNSVNNM